MALCATPTTDDLSIICPEFRNFIARFPRTIERATSVQAVMKFMRAMPPVLDNAGPNVDRRDMHISSPRARLDQPAVSARVWRPLNMGVGERLPCVLWMHHGGLFSSGPRQLDYFCSSLAAEVRAIVICPAVRQTPEHPFPARKYIHAMVPNRLNELGVRIAFEDAYDTFRWLVLSPESIRLGVDIDRLALGGTSVGGMLAAGIALRLRDELNGAQPIRLLVMDDATVTDLSCTYSTQHNPINRIWNANVTRYMWQLYLPEGVKSLTPEARDYAIPGRAKDVRGLPNSLVLCAEWDDLRDDAIAFALRLLQAGVPTEIHTYRGTFHISDKLIPNAKASVQKRQDIVEALRVAFAQ